ncbi:DNA replication/repair protein RecF [Pseudogracilibacillus auburnensis]|uniref:DNA replication/repair protein RecF n=1 Tax=Pseudogracilibacillus auburnensis TaxID=1494959 RepID=UPI001A96B954|nr:DNA replication/repair protein RecF [Pseudogracilibacillus auburnensis]MBO1004176.1 DNA replication/repair protein RecF [Pseudogracilibacillus auburnensis]
MFIKQLQLKNYRNYEQLDISFDNKVNVIIGENAQGKTNLLEAIYLLAFTKSYRTANDRELILWDKDFAKITGMISKNNDQQIPLELIFHKTGKKAKLNRLEQKRLSEYIGALNVVMFAPEDLSLVKGSPQVRRRFIDMELGQIEPIYIYHLGQYQKILKQRNHLLKQLQHQKQQDITFLHVLTDQLVKHAAIIVKKRFDFLKLLRKWAIPIHLQISRELEQLDIVYTSTIEVLEDDDEGKLENKYYAAFSEVEANEIRRGSTLVGPHRDDLIFYINHKDVKLYGSQGQQRTTALSLKLAEIDLIYEQIKEYPILLLDDVLSELDDFRQSHLLSTIQGKVQTFVSTTTVDGINHDTLKQASIYSVQKGTITPY